MRRIDYHKLEEVKGLADYTYFFRHCWSTRLCVKLQREGGDKALLYGYNGMGLHKSHPSWRSLVVRSRKAELTARLLCVLGPPVSPQDFVDGVSSECTSTYEQCMGIINTSLVARGEGLPSAGASSARTTPPRTDAASTDGRDESEGGELEGGESEEAPEWPDEED